MRSDTRPRSKLRIAADDAAEFAYVLWTMIDDRLRTIDKDDGGDEPRVCIEHEIIIAA